MTESKPPFWLRLKWSIRSKYLENEVESVINRNAENSSIIFKSNMLKKHFLTVIFVNMVANPLYRLVSQWRSHGLRDAAASRCFRTPNHMFSYIEKKHWA